MPWGSTTSCGRSAPPTSRSSPPTSSVTWPPWPETWCSPGARPSRRGTSPNAPGPPSRTSWPCGGPWASWSPMRTGPCSPRTTPSSPRSWCSPIRWGPTEASCYGCSATRCRGSPRRRWPSTSRPRNRPATHPDWTCWPGPGSRPWSTPPPSGWVTRWGRSSPITCGTPSTGSGRPRPRSVTGHCTAWPSASWIWSASLPSHCTLPPRHCSN